MTNETPHREPGPTLDPTKLLRIGMMTREMLAETRRAPIDEQARDRLRDTLDRTVTELKEVLPTELGEELGDITLPLEDGATEDELRLAQAQLVGWLEGLFHGIQASLFAQQMQMQQQAENYPRRPLPPEQGSGQYL